MPANKLLVADDSLTIQKVIRLALSGAGASAGSQEGYAIQAVSDGNDAIQQISLFRPDIVLIDVSLPGKSAFEVKRAINEHRDLVDIRFVLMSSAFEKVDEAQAQEVVFHGRLTKPFDPAHLREVLSDVMAQLKTAPAAPPTSSPDENAVFLDNPDLDIAPPPPIPPSIEPTEERRASRAGFAPPPVPAMAAPSSRPEPSWPPASRPSPPPSFVPAPDEGSWGAPPMVPPSTPPAELDRGTRRGFPEEPPLPPPGFPAGAFEEPGAFPPEPTFPLPPSQGREVERMDTDIHALTDSTMRMAGNTEDFGWSVQEHLLKPPENLMDDGRTSFPMTSSRPMHPERTLPPPAPEERYWKATAAVPQVMASTPPPAPVEPPPLAPPPAPALPMDRIEEIIRNEVEKNLRRLAQDMLPDIAERIIKQEIRRMLSEQP